MMRQPAASTATLRGPSRAQWGIERSFLVSADLTPI